LLAFATQSASRCSSASRLSMPPERVVNTNSLPWLRGSESQLRSSATTGLVSGVIRCFRPFPKAIWPRDGGLARGSIRVSIFQILIIYGGYPDVIPGVNPNLPRSKRSYDRWFNTAQFSCNATVTANDPTGTCGLGSTISGPPIPYTYSQLGAFMIPGCPLTDPLCLNTQQPVVGRYGNASANSLHGDPLDVHHLSVSKAFPLTERVRMTYTALISNLFNHPHYYNPDGTITDYSVNGNIGCVGVLGGLGCGGSETGAEYNHAGFRSIAMKLRVEF